MPRNGAEVAGVKVVGATDFGRCRNKQMERVRDERSESGQRERAARARAGFVPRAQVRSA
jgi:hypothetical protein